jgi:O-methyltransferase
MSRNGSTRSGSQGESRNMITGNTMIERLFPLPYHRAMMHAAKHLSGLTREVVLGRAMEYTRSAGLDGDYLEFGVWRGRAFAAACYLAKSRAPSMNFYAFDSFCGLPDKNELDASGHQMFKAGEYSCSEREFLKNVRRTGANMKRVTTVPGWFDESLKADNPVSLIFARPL